MEMVLEVLYAHPGFLFPAVLPILLLFMRFTKMKPQKKKETISIKILCIWFRPYTTGSLVDLKL